MDNNSNKKIMNNLSHSNSSDETQNAHLESLGLSGNNYFHFKRRYTKCQEINRLAIEKYKEIGKGVSFASFVAERLGDESLEETEDALMEVECVNRSLILLPEWAQKIYFGANANRNYEIIPEFQLDHNGILIVSIRMTRKNLQENQAEADSLLRRFEK